MASSPLEGALVTRAAHAVGVLCDHATVGGAAFQRVVRRALTEARAAGRLPFDVDLVEERGDGLPDGSAAAVAAALGRLVENRAVLAVIGPAISDNALAVRDLADAAGLPCINWTGDEQTRSEWMFHYQVGSLDEEPFLLAEHLQATGARRVALFGDDSGVGRRCGEAFVGAASRHELELVRRATVGVDATDLLPEVLGRVREDAPQALVYFGLWRVAHALAAAAAPAFAGLTPAPRLLANSSLMFGHARPEWRAHWEGWRYVDAYSDRNPVLRALLGRLGEPEMAHVTAAAAYDMGRLVAEGIAGADAATRAGVKHGLERVKRLAAATGGSGTMMGFGRWDRVALKGRFLVLREWRGGASVEVD